MDLGHPVSRIRCHQLVTHIHTFFLSLALCTSTYMYFQKSHQVTSNKGYLRGKMLATRSAEGHFPFIRLSSILLAFYFCAYTTFSKKKFFFF